VLALFEDDHTAVADVVKKLGYETAHTRRVAERDVELFVHLFRDGTVCSKGIEVKLPRLILMYC
jgi:hypothetical protein